MASPTTLPSPAMLQRHLHGIDYPVSRDELISYARRECEGGTHPQDECERVMQVLSQLPDREYDSPVDVSRAFGEVARSYLQQASYPARPADLVTSAQQQGADQVVLDTIVLIPDREYPDVNAVIIAITGGG